MANTPQARKRARQNSERRLHNHSRASEMRTYIKRFLRAVKSGDQDAARSAYGLAVARIDRLARKRLHHPNRAARLKSRLNERLRELSSQS